PHRPPLQEAQRIAEGKRLLRSGREYADAADTFRALGDPSRVKIVDALLRQELCTSDLADITGLSEPSVSQHLRLLRMMRIVSGHRHGRNVFYALEDEHVRSLLTLTMAHLQDDAAEQTG
ncbi:MAG: metalloregulator ArsR/SmtB family transcription factor, partial [Dehalococcoidia bacterium]